MGRGGIPYDFAARNREFEKLLDDVYLQDHIHPSNIPNTHMTAEERMQERAYADGVGHPSRYYSTTSSGGGGVAVHHSNPSYCGGLPRKHYVDGHREKVSESKSEGSSCLAVAFGALLALSACGGLIYLVKLAGGG